ncbi:MAG: hypothetical protein LLG01_17080 [Planctomycetaceae bacterium]|nr:hypothetical protein [Planctomycetaceae bacterium]
MSALPPPIPPAAPAIADACGGSPLTADQLGQFQQAQAQAEKFRRASGLAMFNIVGFVICAAGSGLIAMVSLAMGQRDLWGVVLTLGLCAGGFCEWHGRQMLLNLDPRGPRLLGWNQMGLMALILAYCAWQMVAAVYFPDPAAAKTYADLKSLGMDLGKIEKQLTLLSYSLVALTVVVFQGLCARYYFSRIKILKDYISQTPQWIIDLRRMQNPIK